MGNRFRKIAAEDIGEEFSQYYDWWMDTLRPLPINEYRKGKDASLQFMAVEAEKGKDPNNFVPCTNMGLLFNDAAEYYFVCRDCRSIYSSYQWSGHTKAVGGWRERSERELKKHEETKGWCQFCDSVFGNGGWSIH